MLMLVIFGLLLLIAALAMQAVYNIAPAYEIKRRAAARDPLAMALYRAIHFDGGLRSLLWIVHLLGAVVLVFAAANWGALAAAAAVLLVLFLQWSFAAATLPNAVTGAVMHINTVVVFLLQYIGKPLAFMARKLRPHSRASSGMYELQDLKTLLKKQPKQPGNRIAPEQLERMRRAVDFYDVSVRDVFTPTKKAAFVAATDSIGPILLDELHATGQGSFLVKKTARSKTIVGVLHEADIDIRSKGTVEDHMQAVFPQVVDVQPLSEVLPVFYHTKQQLAMVVDDQGDMLGVLSLQQVLETLLGKIAASESVETVVE